VPAPDFPFQLVHQDDLGAAIAACALGDGPPGAYNVAADDVLTGVDVARELGLTPIAVPSRLTQAAARITASLPLPAPVEWVEAGAHPAIMDTTKAKEELGWSPRHSARDTLRETLGIQA
jgi:nucleoside-diphosphate-sugar epimerase